ncbi:MAG: helix-turn-helix transcriptional regulator [Rhodothermales bacterium]
MDVTPLHDHRLTAALETLLSPLAYPDVDGWRKAVCNALKDLLDADIALVKLPADVLNGAAPAYSDDVDMEHLNRYGEALGPLDARFDAWTRAAALGVCDRRGLWGDALAAYYDSAYFHEFIRPIQFYGSALLTFDAHRACRASLRPRSRPDAPVRYDDALQFVVARSDRRAEFDGCGEAVFQFGEGHLRTLALLRPAARAGVEFLRHFSQYRSALVDAVDATGVALLLTDERGREQHRTPSLIDLLGSAQAPFSGSVLLGAARRCARSAVTPTGTPCACRLGPYRLACTLLDGVGRAHGGKGGERLIAVTISHDRSLPTPGDIVKRHGLTRQQARVALLLAERRTNEEVAEALCISPHTAHRHTTAVLAGLGLSSRRDVRRMLLDAE